MCWRCSRGVSGVREGQLWCVRFEMQFRGGNLYRSLVSHCCVPMNNGTIGKLMYKGLGSKLEYLILSRLRLV